MATFSDWWETGPGGRYVSMWERWYIDKHRRPPFEGKVADGLGLLNARINPKYALHLMYDEFKWDPLTSNYNSFNYFVNNPAPSRDLILNDYREHGLEFYVYIMTSSLYVTYKLIKENDIFELYLPPSCIDNNVVVKCKVVDPSNPTLKKHQITRIWGTPFSFPSLALPVFLKIEPEELAKIKQVFDDNDMNTLTFNLRHQYAKEEKNTIESYESIHYINSSPTNEKIINTFSHFFTFWKEKPKQIRLLVASDIHVAERFDVIKDENIANVPPDGDYCNYNDQARRLQKRALEHWRKGEVDFVVLNGDLIDYVLKDSVSIEVNLEPTAEFNDSPKPFSMGEYGIHYPSLLDNDSVGHVAFRDAPGGSANVERAKSVLDMLGETDKTNWKEFSDIFGPMMDCVRTFLVPGNHDYEVFGYEFLGLSEDQFNDFVDAVADDTVESRHETKLNVLSAIIGSRSAAIDFLIALGGGLPSYTDVSHYKTTGLTRNEAKQYDDNKRALISNFRPLLSAFWAEHAVAGLHFGHNGDVRTDNSSHEIPHENGFVRLAFFDSGPIYNHLVNPSPWLRGFPKPEKGRNSAIQKLEEWRDGGAYKDDLLFLFMHAPPLSRMFPHQGVSYSSSCLEYLTWHPDLFENYNTVCHPSSLWSAENYEGLVNKDPAYAVPYHNHKSLLFALSPLIFEGNHSHREGDTFSDLSEFKRRERPVLTFAGHTHWKHTYSIVEMVKGAGDYLDQGFQGCAHYLYGNELIDELHNYSDNNSASDWWKNRSLIVTTGCVGPIPSPDFKDEYTPSQPGDPGFTPPFESQGYYIVTIEDGVVTRIDWNKLWYKD